MLRIKHSNHSKNSPSPFWLKDRLTASQQNGTAMKPLYFTPGFIPTPNGKVDVKLEREHVQPGHVFESAYLESPQLPERDLYAPLPSEAQLDETLKKLTVLREELVFISKDEYQQFWLNIYNREPPIGLDHNKMNTFQGLKSIVNKATYLGYQDKATETGNKLCRQVLQNCYYKIPEASEMAAHIKNKYALVMRNPPASKCKDFIEKICSNAKNDLNKDFPMIFVQPNKTQFPDAFSPLLKLEDLLSKKGKEKLEAKSDLTVSTSSLSSPSTNSATNYSNAGTLATIDKDMIYANIDLKNNTPISPTEIISLLTLAEVGGNNEESSTASLFNEDKMPALPDLKMPAFNEPSGSDYDFENDSDIIGIYDVHVKKQYVPVHRKVAKPTMNISEILNSKKILKDTNQKRKDDQKEKKEAKRTKVRFFYFHFYFFNHLKNAFLFYDRFQRVLQL